MVTRRSSTSSSRRNANLGMNLEIAMALAEFRAGLGENSFVIFCRAQRRLISGGPEFSRRHVAQIDERAPAIAGRILAPAGDGEIFPATVAAAGTADSDMIAAIGKKMNLRRRAKSGLLKNPHDIFALAETAAVLLPAQGLRARRWPPFWEAAPATTNQPSSAMGAT